MIDNQDKQTQPLDLGEQPKRKGRPATGQALSNAERQRLWRERQKAQRNDKSATGPSWEDVGALTAQIDAMHEELEQAKSRIKELEAQLAQRNEKAAKLPEDQTYTLQARTGSGKWQNLVAGIYGEEASRQLDRVIDNKLMGGAKNRQYRLVED